ncbi:MAG TPA: cytochrome C oxidase subunit II, partial [Myxococcota bacterium]|nr:cytochrome C oxidase subunit II [Myxococcota bacterium]
MQEIAGWVTGIGVGAVGAVFAWVAWRSGPRSEDPAPARRAGRLRAWGFALAVAAFVPLTGLSLAHTPYGADPDGAIAIDATAHQWYWELSRSRVPVGRLVVFRVTSADVNHGFAVYDPDLRLLGQTQAMPGYANLLALRFARTGTHR